MAEGGAPKNGKDDKIKQSTSNDHRTTEHDGSLNLGIQAQLNISYRPNVNLQQSTFHTSTPKNIKQAPTTTTTTKVRKLDNKEVKITVRVRSTETQGEYPLKIIKGASVARSELIDFLNKMLGDAEPSTSSETPADRTLVVKTQENKYFVTKAVLKDVEQIIKDVETTTVTDKERDLTGVGTVNILALDIWCESAVDIKRYSAIREVLEKKCLGKLEQKQYIHNAQCRENHCHQNEICEVVHDVYIRVLSEDKKGNKGMKKGAKDKGRTSTPSEAGL